MKGVDAIAITTILFLKAPKIIGSYTMTLKKENSWPRDLESKVDIEGGKGSGCGWQGDFNSNYKSEVYQ